MLIESPTYTECQLHSFCVCLPRSCTDLRRFPPPCGQNRLPKGKIGEATAWPLLHIRPMPVSTSLPALKTAFGVSPGGNSARPAQSPMNTESLPAFLRDLAEHSFLKGLSREHLEILADCAMLAHFDPGQVIFREGEPANRFYLLKSGKV